MSTDREYQQHETARDTSINTSFEQSSKGRSLAQSKPRDLTQEAIAASFSEQFVTWYKECMSEANTFTEADERMIKIVKKQILKNNPLRIVFIIFLIFSPILITGIYSFVVTKEIISCKSTVGTMKLSQCIECNEQSYFIDISLFWMILTYLIWSVNILAYVFLYYQYRNYAAALTLLLTYNIRTKSTTLQAYKQSVWKLSFFILFTVFSILTTYFIRGVIEKESNSKNCNLIDYSVNPVVQRLYSVTFTVEGNYLNGIQNIFDLLITGFYLWLALDRLMIMQRDPLSEFFDYNIFFHTHFDQEIEFFSHQLNDIKYEVTLNEAMEEFDKVQYESGSKKPFIFYDQVFYETVIMMVANNLRRDKTAKVRKASKQ